MTGAAPRAPDLVDIVELASKPLTFVSISLSAHAGDAP
jgi:hypothetical protein